MAKVVEGYAYTTGEYLSNSTFRETRYVGVARIESPRAFSKDLSTPIWLNHRGPTDAVLLDAFYSPLGMFVVVLVQDDELAETCHGFSIGYTIGGLKKGKLDEISIICGDDRRPGNPSCIVYTLRDPTPKESNGPKPEEINIPLKNERKATMKSINIDPLLEKISGMQKIVRKLRDAGKTDEELTEEKMKNRRKLLGQDEVRGLDAKELKAFRKSMAHELECAPHQIMIS
ncbi:hypothetical protein ELI30_09420 [Rhizobium leguminosarum]|uniref:hypothetical protein n=1 Tax=Rhizobium leguminosarum TaxID=384 RepID=UPI001031DC45|nr:hypothetical protein [Rhizobium leguminosarum]TAV48503.1 hypothetical protein ELI32_09875 [Rhizobium leguminosarum]TAV58003.1 hypothetical protein ELI31_09405 [Rhizobium leguminosarum]TAV68944.1 hypothetical protein ELI30_09420 [Rhizobium leguminosarum]